MSTPGPNFYSFADEFVKLSGMSRDEAVASLEHLKEMDAKSGRGEFLRSALVGAAMFPLAGLMGRRISGALKPFKGGRTLASYPSLPAAAKDLDLEGIGREAGADVFRGGAIGGAVPVLRHQLERNVEKERMKDYIAEHEGRARSEGMREQIRGKVGI